MGSVGRGVAKRGTGEVASIRAGLRMIGRVIGGTPTCRGEARGCRMSGGCAVVGGTSAAGLALVGADAVKGGEAEVLMLGDAGAVALSDSARRKRQKYSFTRAWTKPSLARIRVSSRTFSDFPHPCAFTKGLEKQVPITGVLPQPLPPVTSARRPRPTHLEAGSTAQDNWPL